MTEAEPRRTPEADGHGARNITGHSEVQTGSVSTLNAVFGVLTGSWGMLLRLRTSGLYSNLSSEESGYVYPRYLEFRFSLYRFVFTFT